MKKLFAVVILAALVIALPAGIETRALTTGCVTSPMGTGPGDYLMVPGDSDGVSLRSVYMVANGNVTVSLYHGTSGNPTEIPLTGPITMKPGVPYYFKDEAFPVRPDKGVWLIRSDNDVSVSGFVTYE